MIHNNTVENASKQPEAPSLSDALRPEKPKNALSKGKKKLKALKTLQKIQNTE